MTKRSDEKARDDGTPVREITKGFRWSPRKRGLSLVYRLLLVQGLVACVVIGAATLWATRGTQKLFTAQVEAEQRLVATVSAQALRTIWAANGWEAALRYLDELDTALTNEGSMVAGADVRWVWLDEERKGYSPQVSLDLLRPLVDGEEDLTSFDLRGSGNPLWVTYQPVAFEGLPIGGVEVARSTVAVDEFNAARWRLGLSFAAALILLLLLSASLTGRLYLTGPVEQLIDGLGKIGRGDLGHRHRWSRNDEIGALASAIDGMTKGLQTAVNRAHMEITLRDAAEQQLQNADRQLTQATIQAAYLHDAATPLSTVLGYAQLLEGDDAISEEARAQAKLIKQEAHRTSAIIRRLLSNVRQNKETEAHAEVAVTVAEVAAFLRPFGQRHDVEIVVDNNHAGEAAVALDSLSFGQVMQNLVVNAVQASSKDGVVRIEVSVEAETVIISVRDTGVGMDDAVCQRVFEPYFTTKPEGVGTGLGLYMVRRLVDRVAGSVTVTSVLGQGTSIHVTLPLVKAPPVKAA